MLLKAADDKSKRISLLEDLQRSTLLNPNQKRWLRDELSRLKKGIQGERDSAFYLDSFFKNSTTHVVIHDLRLLVDGDVAQIDHLLIGRAFQFYLLETKNYAGSLLINEQGEFTADYDGDRFGIPSPLEQSRRHERILGTLLESLQITGRTQKAPEFHHLVMLHPKAIIARPPTDKFDSSHVIKADQFPSWHERFVKSRSLTTLLNAGVNMRSLETIQAWGEKLIRQHRPADMLWLPDFMRPSKTSVQPAAVAKPAIRDQVNPPQTQQNANPTATVIAEAPPQDAPKRLICATCGQKISFAEGKFCWNNAARFGGAQYCRTHQSQF